MSYKITLEVETNNEEEAAAMAGRLASEGQGEVTILAIEKIEEHGA